MISWSWLCLRKLFNHPTVLSHGKTSTSTLSLIVHLPNSNQHEQIALHYRRLWQHISDLAFRFLFSSAWINGNWTIPSWLGGVGISAARQCITSAWLWDGVIALAYFLFHFITMGWLFAFLHSGNRGTVDTAGWSNWCVAPSVYGRGWRTNGEVFAHNYDELINYIWHTSCIFCENHKRLTLASPWITVPCSENHITNTEQMTNHSHLTGSELSYVAHGEGRRGAHFPISDATCNRLLFSGWNVTCQAP